jgi:cytochrome c5
MRHLVSALSTDNVAASEKAVAARAAAEKVARELGRAQAAAHTHAERVVERTC